ncbi:MAG: AzlC family ABC transporter permease [Pseudomonadota bacterium]
MARRDPVPFTLAGARAGARAITAFAASTVLYGLAFGVLADQAGLDLTAALMMSALVNSGSAQIVALQIWAEPIPLVALLIAIFGMNARYLLMGAALRPWFARLSRPRAYGSLFFMGDANWLQAMGEWAAGRRDGAFLVGGGLALYAAWLGGTLLGHRLGRAIGAPEAWGLDFLLVAFCASMAVSLWRGRGDLWPLVAAAASAIAVHWALPGPWYILAGGLAGSLTAAWRHEPVA